jgi:hypothetical protein
MKITAVLLALALAFAPAAYVRRERLPAAAVAQVVEGSRHARRAARKVAA